MHYFKKTIPVFFAVVFSLTSSVAQKTPKDVLKELENRAGKYGEISDQIWEWAELGYPQVNEWLEVTETIRYGTSGTFDIRIKRVSDDFELFAYSDNSIINWRPGASFVRPNWGIYRSLLNAQDLRDEFLLYANFSIEEL